LTCNIFPRFPKETTKTTMLRSVCAIVSGGSSGLGAAAAAHIVKHGGKVVVADLPSSRDSFWTITKTWSEIDDYDVPSKIYIHDMPHHNNTFVPVLAFCDTNVTDAEQVSRALDVAEAVFGQPVNAAINCAGIGVAKRTLPNVKDSKQDNIQQQQQQRLFQAHPQELFRKALDVNVMAAFNVARLAAERMAMIEPAVGCSDGLRGCIINTASIAAYEGQVGQVAYAASKGAIVAMTLPMARDLASVGIRVMTIVRKTKSETRKCAPCVVVIGVGCSHTLPFCF
jgi:3-hydroxyacyl-CoA dehydrogenase / 3-hydroxy-2-methylbutyryl-CoA dehydrogenase